METCRYFKYHWKLLQFLGFYFPTRFLVPFILWSVFINFAVTVYYPLSLVIGFFQLTNITEIFANLSLTFTLIACCVKIVIIGLRRKDMRQLRAAVKALDSRISDADEVESISKTMRTVKQIFFGYLLLYLFILLSIGSGTFLYSQKRLIYPAWFPIDWKSSNFNYRIILLYQFAGLCIAGVQNYISDTLPPAMLCLLNGHIRVLALRIEKLAVFENQTKKNHKDLIETIKDHKNIVKFHRNLQKIISPGLFIQVLVTAFNIGINTMALLFIADDIIQIAYLISYLIAIPMQIYLSCYFGSYLKDESQNILNALYSCNWFQQDIQFKKDIITFMERCKRPMELIAGGVTRISLDTFLAVMKSTFSLIAILFKLHPST